MTETTCCLLCGLGAPQPVQDEAGHKFCCLGCARVYALIHEQGIEDVLHTPRPQDLSVSSGPTQRETLGLGGLWCSSCAWLIEEVLAREPGVQQVEVSFAAERATVRYNPIQTDLSTLIERVRSLGYRAIRPGDNLQGEEKRRVFRLALGAALGMNVMMISLLLYARHIFAGRAFLSPTLVLHYQWLLFVVATPAMLLLVPPYLRSGWAGMRRLRPNMHALIAVGSMAAYGVSVYNTVRGVVGVYYDTATMVLVLVTVGRFLETRAVEKGRAAIGALLERTPTRARLWQEGEERIVPADAVRPGNLLRVRAGEWVPADGEVVEGEGYVDEAHLSGESEAVAKRPGDPLYSGSLNLDGAFLVRATAIGEQSFMGRLLALLEEASASRAPIEQLADRIAARFVPAALLLAALTFVWWTAWQGPVAGLTTSLSVLLVACPCALGIATPLAVWTAWGRAAEENILIRDGAALEKLAHLHTLFFDKTGTLTRRTMQLSHVLAVPNGHENQSTLLRYAVSLEQLSTHPLAKTIVAYGEQQDVSALPVQGFRALAGLGVQGHIAGEQVLLGSRRLMEQAGYALSPTAQQAKRQLEQEGHTVVYGGWDGNVRGLLAFTEEVRPEVPETLAQLQEMGVETVVLTGDDRAAGERLARKLDVPVHSELLPKDKVRAVTEAVVAGDGVVGMVGDGINDGPAMARADVGIAVACGTDVAREAADVNLLHGDLRQLPRLLSLARETYRRIRQNLAWAFAYNLVGLALAVTGHLLPIFAAAAMVLSSLFVVRNSLQIQRVGRGATLK